MPLAQLYQYNFHVFFRDSTTMKYICADTTSLLLTFETCSHAILQSCHWHSLQTYKDLGTNHAVLWNVWNNIWLPAFFSAHTSSTSRTSEVLQGSVACAIDNPDILQKISMGFPGRMFRMGRAHAMNIMRGAVTSLFLFQKCYCRKYLMNVYGQDKKKTLSHLWSP